MSEENIKVVTVGKEAWSGGRVVRYQFLNPPWRSMNSVRIQRGMYPYLAVVAYRRALVVISCPTEGFFIFFKMPPSLSGSQGRTVQYLCFLL